MANKKKTIEEKEKLTKVENNTENILKTVTNVIVDEVDTKIKKSLGQEYLFKIKTNNDTVRLRKNPSIKEAPTNIAGKMFPGRTYYVVQEILFTPIKMYKLDNGYYVIADQKIKKVD